MNKPINTKSSFKGHGMFNEANPLVFELAKELRRNMTNAEMVLWGYLRVGVHGLKFRRQHPIGIYIADFYCHKLRLIIEIDGSIHNRIDIKDYDMQRESDLKEWNYTIIRFTNDQVLKAPEQVLAAINSSVESLIKKLSSDHQQKASL
jgi:very-short-patch-repair endonuclease